MSSTRKAFLKHAEVGWEGIHILKVSTLTLCSLTLRSLANSIPSQKQSNGRCSWVCMTIAINVSLGYV